MRYYYDDQRVILEAEYTTGETDQRYFIYGNYIDEVLLMRNLEGTAADYYYGHDHLYSPVVLFDSSGSVVERYEGACPGMFLAGNAYGTARIYNADFTTLKTTSDYNNPYYFTGRRLDTLDGGDLNIMYYRARTYDTVTGRFLQRDPYGIEPSTVSNNTFDIDKNYHDGMNLYEYVNSNPIAHIDPLGLKIEFIKKQYLNEEKIKTPDGGTTRGKVVHIFSEFGYTCERDTVYVYPHPSFKKCHYTLRFDIEFIMKMYLLRIGHMSWEYHYPRYNQKWGSPRSNLTERLACRTHELDHWKVYAASIKEIKAKAGPFDNKDFRFRSKCVRVALCVLRKISSYHRIADEHSADFNNYPLYQGGMYYLNPFTASLNLSDCK